MLAARHSEKGVRKKWIANAKAGRGGASLPWTWPAWRLPWGSAVYGADSSILLRGDTKLKCWTAPSLHSRYTTSVLVLGLPRSTAFFRCQVPARVCWAKSVSLGHSSEALTGFRSGQR